ncbi:unnamed protein product [Closterium sp. NIES-53]
MATPTVLVLDAEGCSLGFDSWLEDIHQYLQIATQDNASLFEHTSGSLPAPEAPTMPAADAREEALTSRATREPTFAKCHRPILSTPLWLGANPPPPTAALGCLALPLTFSAVSDLATVADEGGRSGARGSGGGGQQELEPSCVAACRPTSIGAVPAEVLFSVPVILVDPTSGLVYAHPSTVFLCLVVPFDSSGSTEGGDPAAVDTATSRRSLRLETPQGFPRRMSSPPLQPVVVDIRGPGVVGGGDAEGSASGGVDSGGARSPLVGGVGGIGTGGPGSGADAHLYYSLFLPPNSPLPAPTRYSTLPVSLTGRRVPVSCAASPATSRVTREHVVLPLPPPSSLPAVPYPVSDLARAARSTIPCCLAALMTAPTSSAAAASALIAELEGFAAICCRAYLAGLVSASSWPTSVWDELALGCDVLKDRQFELEYLPYPLSIRNRYVVPGRHHPAHWRAARRVLRYLVRIASRT